METGINIKTLHLPLNFTLSQCKALAKMWNYPQITKNDKMKNRTTQKIKDTLGVSYTIAEVERFLKKAEKKSLAQAPYFDGRILDKIQLLKKALNQN